MKQLVINDGVASGAAQFAAIGSSSSMGAAHAARLGEAAQAGYLVLYLAQLAGVPPTACAVPLQAYLVLYLANEELLR